MARRFRSIRDDQRGMTLIELVVAIATGMTLFLMLTMAVMAAMHETTRVSDRVHSTQNTRTAVHRVVSELHSACVARYVTPIREGSDGDTIKFVHTYSAAVDPQPVLSVVTLEGSELVQYDYPVKSGSSPKWEFNETTAIAKRAIMTNVAPTSGTVPIFSYYPYNEGSVSTTRSTVPLDASRAEKVVKVDVAMQVVPPGRPVTDLSGAAEIQDSVLLRFTPPVYSSTGSNLPCE